MKIGVTQRVEVIKGYYEARDCLDQRWVELLEAIDAELVPIPNNSSCIENWLEKMNVDGIILSGGNDLCSIEGGQNTSLIRDQTEKSIIDFSIRKSLPVLGVCRGMQLINCYFGGVQSSIEGHVANRHSVTAVSKSEEWNQYQNVNSFHTYGISKDELAADLGATVISDDRNVEAFEHKVEKITGIMWHPEREETFSRLDLNLLNSIFGE